MKEKIRLLFFFQRLSAAGVPLYFTVIAENSAGKRSKASCYLPTYDVTLPDGRFQEGFITSSNPDELKAAVRINEDSELNHRMVGVGYGKDIYGDQTIRWSHVYLQKYSHGYIGKSETTYKNINENQK